MSRLLLTAALVQLASVPATAGPIVSEARNGYTFTVTDPDAGLVWLAPRWSNGLTAAEAVAQFSGFHLATLSEVSALFSAAGLPTAAPDASVSVDPPTAAAFRQLWTDTQNVTSTFDSGIPGRVGNAGLTDGNSLVIAVDTGSVLDVPPIQGHWLVRPVPEPTGIVLLIVGLVVVLVGGTGLEPATPCMSSKYSSQLS